MKDAIYSILAIAGCVIIGKVIAHTLGGLPSSLYGLASFTLLLHFKVVSADRIKSSIEWIMKNMIVCFVPAGVGIIEHFELIKQHGFAIVFIIFITTFLLITVIGVLFELKIRKQNNTQNPEKSESVS